MKINHSFRNAAIAFAAVSLLLNVSPVHAQPQPKGENTGRPRQPMGEGRMNERRPQDGQQGFQPGGQQGFNGVNMMERILTEDQRESIRKSLESNREKTRANMEKIREANKELNKLALDGEFKEDAVRAKAMEIAKLEVEMKVMRLKALSEVQPALSQEQMDKVMNPPQMLPQQGGRPDEQSGGSGFRRMNRPDGLPGDSTESPQRPKRERQ
jgi:Spy/CpxP family protein refolding chaperone